MKKAVKQSTFSNLVNLTSVILILLSLCLMVLSNTARTNEIQSRHNRFNLTLNANRLKNASGFLTDEVRAYAANGQQVHYDQYWNEVNTLKNRDIAIEEMNNIGLTAQEKAIIDTIGDTSNNLIPLEEQAMQQVQRGNNAAAIAIVYGDEYAAGIRKITELTEQFLTMIDERSVQTVQTAKDLTDRFNLFSMLALGLVGICQAVNLFYMKKRIIGPIIAINQEMLEISKGNLSADFSLVPDTSEIGTLTNSILQSKHFLKDMIGDISDVLEKMSAGRLDHTVHADYMGEFSQIKQSLLYILTALNKILLQVSHSADQVLTGADQVSGGAQALAQGTTEQAGSIQELTASISEISQTVNQNAKDAKNADEKAIVVGEAVEQSNQKMQQMITAMSHISQKSSDIGHIIKTIDDIAFQTNILALNAAVEAARAGNAGKGFAVVAEEVRNLAGKSAEAARQTSTLIEETIQAVERGSVIADETGQALNQVVTGAREINALLHRISQASGDQAAALTQVYQGVEQISAVVQTNSATAEQSAAASQELSGQAMMLQQLISQFTLLKENPTMHSTHESTSAAVYETARLGLSSGSKYGV